MNTTTPQGTNTGGLGFWKVLGIIAVVLIALVMIGPLLKGLFWIVLLGLAVYGAYVLLRSRSGSSG